ncbi:MAG: hypothetical protein P8N52_04595 [Crocinitomicaceae bacterium]|nr:hypothetical protein [Crocinitomicaceae bacterium]MDG1776596.1 hypothetical protein [Crocinitomicaceae bacterium]
MSNLLKNDDLAFQQFGLKTRITQLNKELDEVLTKTSAFEAILRAHLEKDIIQERELNRIYRKLRNLKKQKRLAQKRRGKNYKEPTSTLIPPKKELSEVPLTDRQELKRLYKETMFLVHPDKYSLNEDMGEKATEATSNLIDIYRAGDLEKLRLFHQHVLSGNAIDENEVVADEPDAYLQGEIQRLENALLEAKSKRTYQVVTTYDNPVLYVDELKVFYADRIAKLIKRTRKA